MNGFISVRRVTGVMVGAVATTVYIALAMAFLSFLVREILRREWLAGAGLVLIFAVIGGGGAPVAAGMLGR